jgi:hypothetical protein
MDDNETDGVSSSAKRLFDWVSDPSNNGSVYRSDVPTYIIREVLSLLSEEDGIFEEEEGEEEWDSSHLSVRPGIQPAIASYQLLLGVLGPSVEGGDDMTERVALRGAIISRVDFLAQAMAAVDMSLGDMYSSWHKVCVLPELEGCESTRITILGKGTKMTNTPPDFLKASCIVTTILCLSPHVPTVGMVVMSICTKIEFVQ